MKLTMKEKQLNMLISHMFQLLPMKKLKITMITKRKIHLNIYMEMVISTHLSMMQSMLEKQATIIDLELKVQQLKLI